MSGGTWIREDATEKLERMAREGNPKPSSKHAMEAALDVLRDQRKILEESPSPFAAGEALLKIKEAATIIDRAIQEATNPLVEASRFYSGYTRGLAVKEGHARGYVKALQEALRAHEEG